VLYCTLKPVLHPVYFVAPTLQNRSKATTAMPNINPRGGNTYSLLSITISVIISVTVLVITIMLMVMCHCTNKRRRQEQREIERARVELRAIEEGVRTRKGSKTNAGEISGTEDQGSTASSK
jgi:hypothetical protein